MSEALAEGGPIATAVAKVVAGIAAVVAAEGFSPTIGDEEPASVVTETPDDARRASGTGSPIRSPDYGTRVRVSGGERAFRPARDIRTWVTNALYLASIWRSGWRQQSQSESLRAALERLRVELDELAVALRAAPRAQFLLRDGRGYKTYGPEEIEAKVASAEEPRAFIEEVILSLADLFANAASRCDLRVESNADGTAWSRFAAEVFAAFAELEHRTHHRYQITVLLNGPLIPQEEEVDLGPVLNWSEALRVRLAPVTDTLLASLCEPTGQRLGLPHGAESANLAISFSVDLEIDAPLETFLRVYPFAAFVTQALLDVLRIVVEGDTGVSSLHVQPATPISPSIRPEYAWQYRPELAPIIARRAVFGPPRTDAMSDEEISLVRALAPRHVAGMDVRGLPVALARFRDSYERHLPDELGRLLDVAIAFEALLLNDQGDKKDLSYKLRIRGARWLAHERTSRELVFVTLGQLYTWRSQIAHGAMIGELKEGKQRELEAVQRDAPALLRTALRKVLAGEMAEGKDSEKLSRFWRGIELGS